MIRITLQIIPMQAILMTLPHIQNALRLIGAVAYIDRANPQAIRHGFRQAHHPAARQLGGGFF